MYGPPGVGQDGELPPAAVAGAAPATAPPLPPAGGSSLPAGAANGLINGSLNGSTAAMQALPSPGMHPFDTNSYKESPPPESAAAHFAQRQKWAPRFGAQFMALSKKNVLVQFRNMRATVLRVLAPLFFMLLLFLVDIALTADSPKRPYAVANLSPEVTAVGGIPPCEDNPYAKSPCYDFFYTPNTPEFTALAQSMAANNSGRPIDWSRVLNFSSPAAANDWLREAANKERVLGGVHFSSPGVSGLPGSVDFLLQVNTSVRFFKDQFVDPNFEMQVPLQVATERAIAERYFASQAQPLAGWDVSTSMFAHPTTNSINIVGKVIGGFVFAANLFSFSLILSSVVAERERGLRQALKTAGMLESAFWLSWLLVEVVAAVLFTLLLIAFGAMFQFDFFLKNSFALVFCTFFVFQLAMVSFAFMLSTLISKSSTAIYLGFVVFLVGWIMQAVVVFGWPYEPDYIGSLPVVTVIFSLFPWSPLAKACDDLGAATEDESSVGISWSNRAAYCQNKADDRAAQGFVAGVYRDFDCVFPISSAIWVMFFEAIAYFLIAIWLDHVLADENGVRKGRPWYFLTPSYWTGSGGRARGQASVRTSRGVRGLNPPLARLAQVEAGDAGLDPDVAAEEARMKDLLAHRSGSASALSLAGDEANAVEVYGLQKVFGAGCCGGRGCKGVFCFCCVKKPTRRRGRGGGEFVAIRGSWFGVERGRVFCLLGPNGAGKTTSINCLTGVLPPSGGDALVYGESISTPGGMDRVRALMGVCPQFDVLWPELTGREHLQLFGRIKGLSRAAVADEAAQLLDSVKLSAAGGLRTGAYSGGMRRRLSVALALLGDPQIVYLDEPTTGMDPISRRHVWDIIEASKPGRAIVLTTHSMEEADILGDQICVMARGRVRAFGSALRLKQTFGSGYQLSVSLQPPLRAGEAASSTGSMRDPAAAAAAVKDLFQEGLGLAPAEEGRSSLSFLVPKDKEGDLPALLQRLDARRDELGVTDVQVSLTSLGEVFLAIARQAELEAAAAEGRSTLEWLLPDGNTLEIGMGEEWAERDGQRYAVRWAQDDTGALQVLSATPVDAAEAQPNGTADASGPNGSGGMQQVPPPQLEMARKDL